jgi:hypothetical protein
MNPNARSLLLFMADGVLERHSWLKSTLEAILPSTSQAALASPTRLT